MATIAQQFGMVEALEILGVKAINEGTSTGNNHFSNGSIIESYSPVDGQLIAKVKTTTPEDYEKAWAYMTYNLNYEPIPKKAVGLKANQIKSYLSHVSKVIAPNDPFAIYHSIQLSNQLGMVPDSEEVSRLQNILNNSDRWIKRFSELNLTLPLNLNQIV